MDPITREETTTTTTRETVTPVPPRAPGSLFVAAVPSAPSRKAAATGLMIVGFIALMVLGIWLAVALARYVPNAVTYLGTVFTPATTTPASVAVIPFSSDNPSGPDAGASVASTTPVATSTSSTIASTTTAETTTTKAPVTYKTVITTYPVSGSTRVVASTTGYYYGLPDLTVKIVAVGYLTSNSPESFIVSSTVPVGMQPAVEFIVTNIGTNVAPVSRFFAFIPTKTAQRYESASQQALNPGANIQYTLGFTEAERGTDQIISVTTNFDGAIAESNTNNNTATAKITIL